MQRATQRLAGALLLAVLLSGCALVEPDEPDPEKLIVGSWRWVYSAGYMGHRYDPTREPERLFQFSKSADYIESYGAHSVAGRYRIEKEQGTYRLYLQRTLPDKEVVFHYELEVGIDSLRLYMRDVTDAPDYLAYVRVR